MFVSAARQCPFFARLLVLLSFFFTVAAPSHAISHGVNALTLNGQVQVWIDHRFQCTGSLIDTGWVLTAKHCITFHAGTVDNTFIILGDLRLQIGETHFVSGIYLNPDHDVALVRLNYPTFQLNLVKPYGVLRPTLGDRAIFQGWGSNENGPLVPPAPLQASTHTVIPVPNIALDPLIGPRADIVTTYSDFGILENGDSGAGSFNLGLICGVFSLGDAPGPYAYSVASDAVADWILQTSGVFAGGLCRLPQADQLNVRVMALGDRITQGIGGSTPDAYRGQFYAGMSNYGLQVTMVGVNSNGNAPSDRWEGQSGDRIGDLKLDAQCSIPYRTPNIVTIETGEDELVHSENPYTSADQVDSLISTIEQVAPGITVLVASLPPNRNLNAETAEFNTALKRAVLKHTNAGEHVAYVDLGNMTVDDVVYNPNDNFAAPTSTGYMKMGNDFALAVETAVVQGWVNGRPNFNTSQCSTPPPSGGDSGWRPPISETRTFTVNAGGVSFKTTQPNNSVATYTWTDNGLPSEWLTSTSGSVLEDKLGSVTVGGLAGAPLSDTINVDAGKTYQTIDGFGGAMTDSASSLIAGSPQRDTIMRTLFGTDDGQAGLTMVRSPMGSSDLMADPGDFHTYEDTPGSFSASVYASDNRQIDVLKQAKGLVGGDFKLIGTPWSAPGWMKRGGSLRPAQCGTEENELDLNHVGDYAGYFKNYVNEYASLGLKPWMVSMGNEPENCKTRMPTTLLSSTDEVALAKALKSQLPGDVKVLGWDHNWNDKDYVNTLTGQGAGSVDAIGYHCYDGTHYGNQTQAVPTYMTECSGFTDQSGNVAANLGFEVANLLIGPLRYGSHGSLYWTLAQDPSGNPHLGGSDACQNCRGMITVNGGSFEPSQDFYYWAQFSKFIRPGAVRIDSNNSGDLSTVAFRDGNRTTLVVLNSSTHADGGSAGSDERDLRGHIVQWNGDSSTQKTAWIVGADGYRRWIGDGSTYNCLKYDAGMQGPDDVAGGALDKYINLKDVWAVCGATVMGTGSELEIGTYLKSTGGARLTLTKDGMRSVDSDGNSRWAPPARNENGIGSPLLTGDRFILQGDGNLELYSGVTPIWTSDTKGSGAIWLAIRDDGTFALFNKANQKVWGSEIDTRSYRGKMVQWDGDTSSQKSTWLVGNDGNRRWVPDMATFQCLHDAGAGNSLNVSSDVLDKLPNIDNVWATCGGAQLGTNGALEQGSFLKSGDATLTLTSSDLVVAVNGTRVWSTGHGGAELKLQTDGNLVEYDAQGNATWASRTNYSDTPAGSSFWLILYNTGTLFLDGNGPDGKNIFSLDVEHLSDIGS